MRITHLKLIDGRSDSTLIPVGDDLAETLRIALSRSYRGIVIYRDSDALLTIENAKTYCVSSTQYESSGVVCEGIEKTIEAIARKAADVFCQGVVIHEIQASHRVQL